MQPGVMKQLGYLVSIYPNGVEHSLMVATDKKYKAMGRGLRRCRILEAHGFVDLIPPVGFMHFHHEAYRVNARGLALWDRFLLDLLP